MLGPADKPVDDELAHPTRRYWTTFARNDVAALRGSPLII
jgi:hypothetical protein